MHEKARVKVRVNVLVSLVVLGLTQTFSVFAETNAAGDEILVLGDMPADNTVQSPFIFNPSLSSDPVLNYLPDTLISQQPASSGPASTVDEQAVVSNDLRDRIISGYAMPELESQYTSNHESWYASRPDYVKRMVARSQKYLYHVVEEVEKRGMPTEIALLPMVESAFNPQAYSRSNASGMWQFIPSTGKDFGLKQNWWVDNRRDVTAATNAALNYLQKLHVMFGTWELALAAYNAGEGTVKRAIERNERAGLPTDYESLPLPPETRNYVPKLQAVKNIMTHPERFGLEIQAIPNRPYFTKVIAPEQIDIKLAAKLAEISDDEFAALNPGYNRPVLTSNGGSVHEILLPVSAAQTFTSNLASYTKPLVSWQTYHAKRGERMDKIASKFGIELAQLRNVNDLSSQSKMKFSRALLVPNSTTGGSAPSGMLAANFSNNTIEASSNDKDDAPSSPLMHSVRPKETLATIAKKYGLNTKTLMAMNELKTPHVKPGQKLNITMVALRTDKSPSLGKGNVTKATITKISARQKATPKKNMHYVVKRGDTLESIARKFDIERGELQRWNNLIGSHIAPGNKLIVQRPSEA